MQWMTNNLSLVAIKNLWGPPYHCRTTEYPQSQNNAYGLARNATYKYHLSSLISVGFRIARPGGFPKDQHRSSFVEREKKTTNNHIEWKMPAFGIKERSTHRIELFSIPEWTHIGLLPWKDGQSETKEVGSIYSILEQSFFNPDPLEDVWFTTPKIPQPAMLSLFAREFCELKSTHTFKFARIEKDCSGTNLPTLLSYLRNLLLGKLAIRGNTSTQKWRTRGQTEHIVGCGLLWPLIHLMSVWVWFATH